MKIFAKNIIVLLTIASPATIGVAPIAVFIAAISSTGPAINEVPVSAIAWQPD